MRYELRDIKKDKWRTQYSQNLTVLGTTVLANTEDKSNTLEAAITYQYNKTIYWGTIEGVSRGLPTIVYENAKSSPVNLTAGWGTRLSENITLVCTILLLTLHSKWTNVLFSFAKQS